jgi:hypothetical protein
LYLLFLGNVQVQEGLEAEAATVAAVEVVTIVAKEGICLGIALNPDVLVNSKKKRQPGLFSFRITTTTKGGHMYIY